jgi:hypothetical protein
MPPFIPRCQHFASFNRDLIKKSLSHRKQNADYCCSGLYHPPHPQQHTHLHTASCPVEDDLWCCVECGVISCGQFSNSHAYDHFVATAHPVTIEVLSCACYWFVSSQTHHNIQSSLIKNNLIDKSLSSLLSFFLFTLRLTFFEVMSATIF